MLKLSLRTCKLGPSINTRAERHGEDENVPAIDVSVSGIILDREEFGDLTEDPELLGMLFKKQTDSTEVPRLADFGPLTFKHKFTDARVTFELGLPKQTVKLVPCKVRKLSFEPVVGGMVRMACQIQCSHEVAPELSKLAPWMNDEVKISISDGSLDRKSNGSDEGQGNLNLEGGGNPPGEDEPAVDESASARPKRKASRSPTRSRSKSKNQRKRAA